MPSVEGSYWERGGGGRQLAEAVGGIRGCCKGGVRADRGLGRSRGGRGRRARLGDEGRYERSCWSRKTQEVI